jgi:hypothetical protein
MSENQRIFDIVARHLLTQKKPAVVQGLYGPACAYRGANGTKCAIGALIDDQHYTKSLEGLSTMMLSWAAGRNLHKALTDSGVKFAELNVYLLRDLQRIHDEVAAFDVKDVVEHWKFQLTQLTQLYKLSADVLKDFP